MNISEGNIHAQSEYVTGIISSIFMIIGIFGNIVTICVLSKRKTKSCFDKLLTALAVIDLIFLLCWGVQVFSISFGYLSYIYILLLPHFLFPLSSFSFTASSLMTVALSVERFVCVCYPLKFSKRKQKSMLYILILIVISLFVKAPHCFVLELVWIQGEVKTELNYRQSAFAKSEIYLKYYLVFLTIFTYILPTLLLVFLNARIFLTLKMRNLGRCSERIRCRPKMRREIRMCFVLFFIVASFVILHLPRTILNICDVFNIINQEEFNQLLFYRILIPVSDTGATLNSSINFIIYWCMAPKFKKELKSVLFCLCP